MSPIPDRPNAILITSIPYGIEKDALVERIGELIAKGQVPQLTNVKDLSTDDVRILLELQARRQCRRGAGVPVQELAAPDQLQHQSHLPAAGRGSRGRGPQPARPEDDPPALPRLPPGGRHPAARSSSCRNLLERIHILEGFAIVFKNLDEAIQIIRASDGKADAAPKLIARFELSEIQADAVLETKLYRLGKLEIRDILERAGAEAEAGQGDPAAARTTSRRGGRSSGAS